MIDHHLPPDPDLRHLIERSREQLDGLVGTARSASDVQEQLMETLQGSQEQPDDIAALKTAADLLMEQARWSQALPLATRLLLAAPCDPSASYRLGTCLQRMGRPAEALPAFTHCLMHQGDHPGPGPLLRLGECLLATGHRDEALQCLDACVEISRSDPSHRHLQSAAAHLADRLRR